MKHLLLSAIVLLASTSFAASTGSFSISGTVAAINDIVITPNLANKDSLPIVAGGSAINVASVAESSNNLNGYKIMMSSLNSSKLVHAVNALYFTNYTVNYDGGAPVTLTSTPQQVKNSGLLTGLTADTSLVNVNVTAFPTAPAGTYSDTITISIEAL